MVPAWFGDEFEVLRREGLMAGTQNNGYLMHLVLTSVDADWGETSRLPVLGGDLLAEGEEDPEYGFLGSEVLVLDPDRVREAADFLRAVPVEEWVARLDGALSEEVVELGFSRSWSPGWAGELSSDLTALREFFASAAEAGDVVVKVEQS
jgi:hypothetical protein